MQVAKDWKKGLLIATGLLLLIIASFLLENSRQDAQKSNYKSDTWVLLSTDNNNSYYYDESTIKKIDDNMLEVYDSSITQKGKLVRQLRVYCKTEQYAIGRSVMYLKGSGTTFQQADFSEQGWVWFEAKNNIEKKLINIICSKK